MQAIHQHIPTSLAEFQEWDFVDGFKYEWNDGDKV